MCSETTKVVIISGASSGIGAALVTAYRKIGYHVVANSRTIAGSADPGIVSAAGDISDPETAERIVSEAISRYGRVDTLINNAGLFTAKPFNECTPKDYEMVMGTNVGGFFHLTTRVITQMLDQGNGGHIVNVTSTLVEQPDARIPAALTALSKGALSSVTKALAIEYAGRGIRVNAVSPGVIDTPMHAGVDVHATYAGMHPQNRVGTVDDITQGVLYLESAHFVTGEILHVDGGQSAGH